MLFCSSFTQSERFLQTDQFITRLQVVVMTNFIRMLLRSVIVNVFKSDAVIWWQRSSAPPLHLHAAKNVASFCSALTLLGYARTLQHGNRQKQILAKRCHTLVKWNEKEIDLQSENQTLSPHEGPSSCTTTCGTVPNVFFLVVETIRNLIHICTKPHSSNGISIQNLNSQVHVCSSPKRIQHVGAGSA